jgi:hypothetical protein
LIVFLVLLAACGGPEPPVRQGPSLSEPATDEATASERGDTTTGYNACSSRHYAECAGPRPLCVFSPEAHEDRWSVCSQRCEEDSDCHTAPPGGTAPVRCKPIIKYPPPAGACVLDCEDGQTCPDGMVCATWLGICAHAETSGSVM